MEEQYPLVEVSEAVNDIKSCKAPGMDGFPVECLKKGGMAVLEWLVKTVEHRKMYFGRLWIWKRPLILSINIVCGRC